MTQHSDIERLLDHWFKEGPDQAPDRVVDIVTDRIERLSQRPAWHRHSMQFPANLFAKIAVAAAAVVIVAVVGYNVFPGRSTGVGGPAPSASPTPSVSPPATLSTWPNWFPERLGRGILAAGRQTTRLFEPSFTFTVPADWVNSVDGGDSYALFPDTPANAAEYALSRDTASAIYVHILPSRSSDEFGVCPWVDPSAGPSATASLAPPTPSQAVIVTDPVAVTIGGLNGTWVDVQLDPSWTGRCTLQPEDPSTRDYKDVRYRIFQLDTLAGGSIEIMIESLYAADSDRFLDEAMPIIQSFQFDVTP